MRNIACSSSNNTARARPEPTFATQFKVQDAIQVLISSAYRSGSPLSSVAAAQHLHEAFPNSGLSLDELRTAVREAALDAGVALN